MTAPLPSHMPNSSPTSDNNLLNTSTSSQGGGRNWEFATPIRKLKTDSEQPTSHAVDAGESDDMKSHAQRLAAETTPKNNGTTAHSTASPMMTTPGPSANGFMTPQPMRHQQPSPMSNDGSGGVPTLPLVDPNNPFSGCRLSQFHRYVRAASIANNIQRPNGRSHQQHMQKSAHDRFDVELDALDQNSAQQQQPSSPAWSNHSDSSSLMSSLALASPEATLAVNSRKNRYSNVLPTSSTRVKLLPLPGDPHSSYINANYIRPVFDGNRHTYIAAQAPLPVTMADWWRMIWEQQTTVIVMLTKDKEANKQGQMMYKAHKYWIDTHPELRDNDDEKACRNGQLGNNTAQGTARYGSFDVTVDSVECPHPDVIIRHIRLHRLPAPNTTATHADRHICHIQYIGWQDFGVPQEYTSFTALIDTYRRARQGSAETAPIIVHCSAGIGRTGTFLAIDSVLDYVAYMRQSSSVDPIINICAVVQQLRRGRQGMVQSKSQYVFIYFYIDHCLQHGLFGVDQRADTMVND